MWVERTVEMYLCNMIKKKVYSISSKQYAETHNCVISKLFVHNEMSRLKTVLAACGLTARFSRFSQIKTKEQHPFIPFDFKFLLKNNILVL